MSCSVQSGEVLLAWAKGMCPIPDSVFFARVGPWSVARTRSWRGPQDKIVINFGSSQAGCGRPGPIGFRGGGGGWAQVSSL